MSSIAQSPESETVQRRMPGTRLWGFSGAGIFVTGVMLIPVGLGIIFNSYSAPDAEAYVRMAFAQVAGATIAIITVLGLLVHRVVRRSPLSSVLWSGLLALIIGMMSIDAINWSADFLLNGLGSLGLM